MDGRITREEALAAVEHQREAWLALVAEVGPERLETPGAMGDWTFKDLAAHLNGWQERKVSLLENVAAGKYELPPEPWPADITDVHDINDWIYAANKDRPVDEVLADATAQYDRMRAAVEKIPEDVLNEKGLFPWLEDEPFAARLVDGRLFDHYPDEHEADVRRWLAETRT